MHRQYSEDRLRRHRHRYLERSRLTTRRLTDGTRRTARGAWRAVAVAGHRFGRGDQSPGASRADPGMVATIGPRYFGFVTGGAVPVTVGRRLDGQRVGSERLPLRDSPAASVIEDIVVGWVVRAPRTAGERRRWIRHWLPHGELHLPRGGAPRGVASRRVGTSRRKGCNARRTCV